MPEWDKSLKEVYPNSFHKGGDSMSDMSIGELDKLVTLRMTDKNAYEKYMAEVEEVMSDLLAISKRVAGKSWSDAIQRLD
jgi:hypothetical protein